MVTSETTRGTKSEYATIQPVPLRVCAVSFADVRGIRIEDDVLVTETGADVLTAAIPKSPDDVEAAMSPR